MKFETQHSHMLANDNSDRNLLIGAPLTPGSPSPPPQKCEIFHLLGDFDEI